MQKKTAENAPGRPRDPETEQRILDAALRLLAEEGYSRMSLDGVAAEAGVSKPTIYRRWSSKADLATAALRGIQTAEPRPDTGSTVGDLTASLENFSRSSCSRICCLLISSNWIWVAPGKSEKLRFTDVLTLSLS